ncbi:reverse transcriptase domain-containing protein [Tanacetum coccineum]
MTAPVISISSDTSEESVGSHAPRVILFGAIPAIIPAIPEGLIVLADPIVIPEVGAVSVVSPSEVLDLVDYSPSSDSDPSEDSLPPALDLPLVSPFLFSDDSKADDESEPAEQRPVSSSHDTLALLSEFPFAPVVAPPEIHSSSSSAPSDHSLSGHTPLDTIDANSSTPQRFVHRSLARTPRHSEAFRRWRSALLSTPYPSTTSESSLGLSSERSLDSSSSSRLSRKRCRFRDSHSLEDSREEHMEVDSTDAEVVADDDEEFEAEASAADTREIIVDPLAIGDSSESSRGGSSRLIIKRDRVDSLRWHMALSQEEFRQDIRLMVRTMTITRSGMTPEAIKELGNRRVEEALAAYEEACAANALEAENQSQNGNDGDNGNGGNGNDGNGNPNENGRGDRPVARECTYQDFMKCQPLYSREREGVVGLIKNNDLAAYTQRFQELTMMCTKMVPEEEDRVEKFTGGLPDNIQGNVIAAKPTKLQDAVRIANNLMDQKLKGYAAGNKNDVCEARGKTYVLGGGDANPDSNVVKGTFLLNNHYAYTIFYSGADRSFVSTTFSTLLDVTPDTLDVSYTVELAVGRITETNNILRGYTLGLLCHPFNVDLMPVELGSFDVIIGMDWLANHHAVIVCDEEGSCESNGK